MVLATSHGAVKTWATGYPKEPNPNQPHKIFTIRWWTRGLFEQIESLLFLIWSVFLGVWWCFFFLLGLKGFGQKPAKQSPRQAGAFIRSLVAISANPPRSAAAISQFFSGGGTGWRSG